MWWLQVILGVHMRGGDKNILPVRPLEAYLALIDAFLGLHGGGGTACQSIGQPATTAGPGTGQGRAAAAAAAACGVRILFATDDRGFEAAMLARYGAILMQQGGGRVERAVRGSAAWSGEAAEQAPDEGANYRRGLQVMPRPRTWCTPTPCTFH